MKYIYVAIILVCFLFSNTEANAQEWSLRLKSSVELRTFKLTNKADISEVKLGGATISLYKGSTLINQMQSDGNGDFIIDVPANGEFVLTVTYQGCNAKKFAISTMGVPEEIQKDNYKPSFGIEGVIMAKAFPTIDYSILKQPLVRVVYVSNGKKFDDEETYTNQMLTELSKIREAENILIERFTSTNNIGDIALSKGDCPLAKASYEKAMTIIPGEPYPGDQLVKVGDCLKNKELAEKKAADEAAAKIAADKLTQEKAAAEKLAKEQEAVKKAEEERLAAQKAAAEKAADEKLVKEKATAEKLAKEKADSEKAIAEKLAKEKAAQEKSQNDKLATEKAEAEKLAKEKANAEKAEADKLAKEKENQEKLQNSKKVAAESAAKAKAATQKAEEGRIAKEKANAEKKQADQLAKEKATASAKTKTEVKGEDDKKKTTPPAETNSGLTSNNPPSESGSMGVNTGDAKYSTPQALGADKYKATIKRADELFKMKRYAEAKPLYEEALKQKVNDSYATAKLSEIEKLIKK